MTDVIPTSSEQAYREQQETLAAAKDTMVGPVPTITDAPDCTVTLPRGITTDEGVSNRAEVRELTGVDEEALAKLRRPEETFDMVLALGVVRIGQLDLASRPVAERRVWLGRLLVGERDLLFLTIAKATYGDDRTFNVTCSRCQLAQELHLKLSEDFPMVRVEKAKERSFTYLTSKGQNISFRLTTGADQNEVLRKDGLTTAEMNTMLLANCITEVDGEMVVDPLNFARNLPMRDRQALVNAQVENSPNIDLSVRVPCGGCGEEIAANLGWLDFFRQ